LEGSASTVENKPALVICNEDVTASTSVSFEDHRIAQLSELAGREGGPIRGKRASRNNIENCG
jgi:hypothetical protein